MSRLGIRLAFAFAVVVAAAIAFVTQRSAVIIASSQEAALQNTSTLHLRAIRRVLAEEAGGIVKRLEPLARVRELRFRVEPATRNSSAAPVEPVEVVADEPIASDSQMPASDTNASVSSGVTDTGATFPATDIVGLGPLDPVGLQRFIEEVLPVTGLDALEVTDADGVVLARGQYPESFGERRADSALATVMSGLLFTGVREEPFPDTGRIALVAAVPIRAGDETGAAVVGMLAGGVRLDRLVGRLAELTGAIVEIATDSRSIVSTGHEIPSAGAGLLDLDGAMYFTAEGEIGLDRKIQGKLRILVPASEGMQARQMLLSENVRLGALVILCAACAGIALALGPTRRLTQLTRAAVGIGGGDLETPIPVRGRDEIGILGETLTRTARALKEERERLATSERVAAWRDAARRLAHELKNAITPIGLALRTVRRAADKGEEGRATAAEALGATEEELKHLQSLVDEFSQFARLPAPRLAPYDLAKALRNAATIYASAGAQPGGPEMRMNIPDLATTLQADEELMGRVWSNLIANAAQAAGPRGWVEVSVAVTSDQSPTGRACVVVTIADSGPGLSASRLAGGHVEGESTKTGGWGVGLALAERIVAEHGGSIALENAVASDYTPGNGSPRGDESRGDLSRGARVRVILPLGEVLAPAERA